MKIFSSVDGAVGAPGGAEVRLSAGSEDFKGALRIRYYAYDALSELTHVAGSLLVPTQRALSQTITLEKRRTMLQTKWEPASKT